MLAVDVGVGILCLSPAEGAAGKWPGSLKYGAFEFFSPEEQLLQTGGGMVRGDNICADQGGRNGNVDGAGV